MPVASVPPSVDAILRIAHEDGLAAYRDLSGYRVSIELRPDGWHVDYELSNPNLNGGGPHYVIDPRAGTILSKYYEQ
jgi:hypothetical protein